MNKIDSNVKRIHLADFVEKRKIGKGPFSIIKIMYNTRLDKYYAIKMMNKSEIIRTEQVEQVISEINLGSSLDFPFIARMIAVAQDQIYINLVIEYVPGGNLLNLLNIVGYFRSSQAAFYTS